MVMFRFSKLMSEYFASKVMTYTAFQSVENCGPTYVSVITECALTRSVTTRFGGCSVFVSAMHNVDAVHTHQIA